MYLPEEATEMHSPEEDVIERPCQPQLLELKRMCQFSDFLHQELRACRTEAERDVVLSALVKSRARILQIARGLHPLDRGALVSIPAEGGASQ